MTLQILIAPSGFKESLDANEVANCIEQGIRRVLSDVKIKKAPLVDGGEGFTKALVEVTNGTLHHLEVIGPVGEPVQAHFGFLGQQKQKTAIIEMASAAGLRLVPRDNRNPLKTTTFGVGQLIKAALDAGAERILIGCGDSGTNDGGAGMVQALGVKLLDENNLPIGLGGEKLKHLKTIDLSTRDPRLDHVQIDIACNWHNILCGPKGVARVFGPQKGATPEEVEKLANALDNFADIIQQQFGIAVHTISGGGASGGMGAGAYALLGANLHPRYDIVMQYLELDELLNDADLIFTAEGSIDYQTPMGKIPAEVARRAKLKNPLLPVIALAGTVGKDALVNYKEGIDAFASILESPCTLPQAISNASNLLTNSAETMMRLVMMGNKLKENRPHFVI
jgi:glycerate 2-kinase